MTRDEFLKEYSGLEVHFVSYYKFRFTYERIHDNKRIVVVMGDSDGDIYRDSFESTEKIDGYSLLDFKVF